MRQTVIEQRQASRSELETRKRDISWFEFRRRRLAREEAEEGLVEVVRFGAGRVWTQITCEGPPCCPNEWVIETEDRLYVSISSWHTLTAIEQQFPGNDVTVIRWPKTLRVISAVATGEAMTPQPGRLEGLEDLLAGYGECRVSAASELPESIRAAFSVAK
jgi:hypothetical protein